MLFNDQRIWSISLVEGREEFFPWPPALSQRLFGSAEVAVENSADGEVLARQWLVFDDSGTTFRFEDARGRPLMLNKWLRPKPMLADGSRSDLRNELLQVLISVRDTLESLHHRVFVVGGTALGPYRDGDLLAHDDDADVAVFLEDGHPSAVARSMMRLSKELRALGYRVRVHSFAHLQVYPPPRQGLDDALYVDVFAAYFSRGNLCQPFHVRGPFKRKQLLPFRQLSIRGESFHAPADVEAWLAMNYDENWRTPQPGFQLVTPSATARRFNSQFGSFNMHRHFWELLATEHPDEVNYERLAGADLNVRLPSRTVVNVGCGTKADLPPSVSTLPDSVIVGIDYSDASRERASGDLEPEVFDVSFANYNAVLHFVGLLPAGAFDIYAGFVAEGQDPRRRKAGFWPLLRMAVKSGGLGTIDFLDSLAENYSFDDPRTWHLQLDELAREADGFGLAVIPVGSGRVIVSGRERTYTRVKIECRSMGGHPPGVTSPAFEGNSTSLMKEVKRMLRRMKSALASFGRSVPPEIASEIVRLNAEIDELREDQRRVSELADIVEELVLGSRTGNGRPNDDGAPGVAGSVEGPA